MFASLIGLSIHILFHNFDVDLLHVNFLAEFRREFGRFEQLRLYT